MELRKRVVIVGGGFVGSYVAKKLEKTFDVILIDTKDYVEYTPGILRALVQPSAATKTQVLHEHYLRKARVEIGEVTRVTPPKVIFNDKEVPYDYLVLASGSTYKKPFRQRNVVVAEHGHELRNHHEQLVEAKRVLVVGGGIVGVELAAEIANTYPLKEVTLVHSKDQLLNTFSWKIAFAATRYLSRAGVKIVYENRVTKVEGKKFTTNTGKQITADLAFMCVGNKPNVTYLEKAFLDEHGRVQVDKHLRIPGTEHIFAGGDITGLSETKLAQNAQKHARIIAENIRRSESGRRLVSYKPGPRPGLIDLGDHAIFFYKNFVYTGKLPVLMKRFLAWSWRRTFR